MAETLDLQKFVTTIIVVSITLILGMYITSEIGDNTTELVTTTGTNVNETLSAVDNVTNSSYAILTTESSASCTTSAVYNSSNDVLVASGNYTAYDDCKLILADDSEYIGYDLDVTYDYSYTLDTATVASNASDDLVTSLSNGTGWIAILIVVGFATVILALLSSGLGQAATGRAEQPVY